jgi:hypothetical protein
MSVRLPVIMPPATVLLPSGSIRIKDRSFVEGEADLADGVHPQRLCRRPGASLQLELSDGLHLHALAAAAALQPVALAGLDAFRLQRDDLSVEGEAGLWLAVDGDDHVAAGHVHLPVEHKRDGVAGNGGIAHEIKGYDLRDIGDHARRQDHDAVAWLH